MTNPGESDLEEASRENLLLARLMCGVAGVLMLVALSFVWIDPPYSNDTGEAYTGWQMLTGGIGISDGAPHLCGEETCGGGESFVVGAMPTLALLLAATLLVMVMVRPTVWRAYSALASGALVVLGIAGLWMWQSMAADNSPDDGQNALRAGLMAVFVCVVVGSVAAGQVSAAVETGRVRARWQR